MIEFYYKFAKFPIKLSYDCAVENWWTVEVSYSKEDKYVAGFVGVQGHGKSIEQAFKSLMENIDILNRK